QRRHDNLIARSEAKRLKNQKCSCRPRRDSDGMVGTAQLSKSAFKLQQLRAANHPSAPDNVSGGLLFFDAEKWAAKGDAAHRANIAVWGIVQFSTVSSMSAAGSGQVRRNQST